MSQLAASLPSVHLPQYDGAIHLAQRHHMTPIAGEANLSDLLDMSRDFVTRGLLEKSRVVHELHRPAAVAHRQQVLAGRAMHRSGLEGQPLVHVVDERPRPLHGPAEDAGPVRPLDVLELRARREVLAVLGLVVQVLIVARVGLDVHAVLAVVEAAHVTVVSVAGALEAEGLSVVDVDLVVHGRQREALSVGAELHVGEPVAGVASFEERLHGGGVQHQEGAVLSLLLAVGRAAQPHDQLAAVR
mmetsp:Transcript_12676/g.17288  ORF Transcript_12676/g.17288 Transcript_12676/m.17288 type:complete len:244 (-) Transcript_12676:512-1243(-)